MSVRGSYSLTRRPVHTGAEPHVVHTGGVGAGSPGHGTTGQLLTAEVPATEGIVRALKDAGIDLVFGIIGGNTQTSSGSLA